MKEFWSMSDLKIITHDTCDNKNEVLLEKSETWEAIYTIFIGELHLEIESGFIKIEQDFLLWMTIWGHIGTLSRFRMWVWFILEACKQQNKIQTFLKIWFEDFPGSPVIGTLSSSVGWGISSILSGRAEIPHALQP